LGLNNTFEWGDDAATVSPDPAPRIRAGLEVEEIGWPFIRGPYYDGNSAEHALAESWPDEGPPVLWTLPLGQGYSSFIAWEDRVATQFQTLAGQFVICLEAESGQEIWRYRYGLPFDPIGVYPGPRATPTYAGGAIYFTTPSGVLGCLDAGSGRRRWLVDLAKRFGTRGIDFGYSCSPTVVEGLVILPVGGPGASMAALDASNGSLVWKAGDDPASYTPAYPITFKGRSLILGYMQNALVCHDRATGELVWRYPLSVGYDEHSAWPIYSEPDLWISGPFQGGSQLLRLTGDSAQPVAMVRSSRIMSNDIFSGVLFEGAVYGFDLREAQAKTHRPSRGQFRCLDFATGEILWSTGVAERRRTIETNAADAGERIGHATVIIADQKLILFNDIGELILARATRQRYDELGRVSVLGGEICWTQPTLFRGRLFVRNHNRAACVYLGQPAMLEATLRAKSITVADIPQSKYVDWAAAILGIEPEYAFDIPSPTWLRQWFLVSLFGIMGGSLLAMSVIGGGLRVTLNCCLSARSRRWLTWSSISVLGVLGTTYVSHWANDFVFTWPVSIFIAFQASVWETGPRAIERSLTQKICAAGVICVFIASCLLYFLVCRRLSLVFEWVFLCGFAGALPFVLAGRFWFADRRWSWLWEVTMTAAAFTAFYWSSVCVLWLRG
jgi:outer membrane protein assembly factor BamB